MMLFYSGVHWDSGVEKVSQQAVRNGSITPNKEVEDMAAKKRDNGKSPLFVVGDKEAKFSIAHAMAKGYRITLDGDGNLVSQFKTQK